MIIPWVMRLYGVSMCSVRLPIRSVLLFKKYWLVVTKSSQIGRKIQHVITCPPLKVATHNIQVSEIWPANFQARRMRVSSRPIK